MKMMTRPMRVGLSSIKPMATKMQVSQITSLSYSASSAPSVKNKCVRYRPLDSISPVIDIVYDNQVDISLECCGKDHTHVNSTNI